MTRLRIVFFGTPDFACPALTALLKEHDVLTVYTQPDRPAGRGQYVLPSPVKQLAKLKAIPVHQPRALKYDDVQATLHTFPADVFVVVAYGLVLPQAVLDMPHYGGINVHASLLPRWRGAAPITRAILAGDAETGISIMQMDAGLDRGHVLQKKSCPILPTDTTGTLEARLAEMGAQLLIDTLKELPKKLASAEAQEGVPTYAGKIMKAEAELDWKKSAVELERAVRAFQPRPVAWMLLKDEMVRIWQASVLTGTTSAAPGTVVSCTKDGCDIATGDGILRITRLQFTSGKALSVAEALNGRLRTLLS